MSKLVPWKSDGAQRQSYNFGSFVLYSFVALFIQDSTKNYCTITIRAGLLKPLLKRL
jgi:hypothetical protein